MPTMSRAAIGLTVALTATVALAAVAPAAPARPTVMVYKSATCGCCKQWIDHLKANGFEVKATDLSGTELDQTKATLGVSPQLASCHTAVIDNKYVVEGHVPASTMKRLLAEKPAGVKGLAVPGMPVGSPGMEIGDRKDPYDVLAFDQRGKTLVYEKR